jgi:hypothetical protein
MVTGNVAITFMVAPLGHLLLPIVPFGSLDRLPSLCPLLHIYYYYYRQLYFNAAAVFCKNNMTPQMIVCSTLKVEFIAE